MTHCSDNLRYGVNFAKRFIDGPDKKGLKKTGELRNLMNLHNNKAGRMVSLVRENKFSCTNSSKNQYNQYRNMKLLHD